MHLRLKSNKSSRKRSNWTPGIESLEAKALLSAVTFAFSPNDDPADTLDQAAELGTFSTAEISGSIDHRGIDVDWLTFTVDVPSQVTLTGSGGTFSLYNDASGTFADALAEIGQRQLAQFTVADSDSASLTRDLAAGTYYVAVSGAGNLYFHPLLAHSGLPGVTGNYTLEISSSPLDLTSSEDPLPLSVDASPLGIWIGLSGELDFAPLVQITNADGLNIPVASVLEALGGAELQVVPGAPLPAGQYTAVVKDLVGDIRLSVEFTVPAVPAAENGDQGNDTPATALDLGDIEDQGLVQVAGIIGDDTYYQLSRSNPALFAGNDVDLYRFQINSTTAVGLQAEVFAGRVGSALDVGLSLYWLDPASGDLVLVSGINNSYNRINATDGSSPLFHDAVVTVGLLAGDYFLAVSQAANTVSPLEGLASGADSGIYDVSLAHSGSSGLGIGRYVLNVQISPLGDSPEVVASSIANLAVLTSAPAEFTVRFSEFMNLAEPAFAAYQQYSESILAGVFISDAQGNKYYPWLKGFDASSLEAHFQMPERLPAGRYQLHLSGDLGVTNLAGVPVAGNSNSGDYVVAFTVASSSVGTGGDPLVWTHDPQTDISSAPQQLGVLFAEELATGVAIVRAGGSGSNQHGDTSDEYHFRSLQTRTFNFHLSGIDIPAGVALALIDQAGNAVPTFSPDGGLSLFVQLPAGEYTLRVGAWASNAARRLNYRIDLHTLGQGDDATPLWSGPAPSVGLRLMGMADSITGGGGSGSNPGGTVPSRPIGGSGGDVGSDGGLSGSVRDATRGNAPGYLSLRTDTRQLDGSSGTDGITIAIPTVTSTIRGSSGLLRIQRSVGQGGGVRDQLSLSGLSDLADGPVGQPGGRNGGLGSALTGRKLSDLVKLSLAAKLRGVSDRATAQNETEAPRPAENVVPADVSIDADVVTAEDPAHETDRDSSTKTSQTEQDAKTPGNAVSQAANTTVGETILEPDAGVAAAESRSTTDTVFAAGLGLLISEYS